MNNFISKDDLNNFFINSNVEINLSNFFYAILLSFILALLVKYTYTKVGKSLNDKSYFSDIFIPLALITTLVITVIKFSLALSLGLVGALSIVRFRAAIKEPEELVYLFFVISIGLSNGANQFILSIFATILIVLFLFAKYFYDNKFKSNYSYFNDANILTISISDNKLKDINLITKKLMNNFHYLKLKSANIENNKSNYIFWYELKNDQVEEFIKNIKENSDEITSISFYSKSSVHE
jgi:uncharacterized membrane protein YhiD involved in acid resistance